MNLYWAIYEGLEEEVLNIADNVLFDDKRLSVYSIKLGNLIVRCSVEIEALSKELYHTLGENL